VEAEAFYGGDGEEGEGGVLRRKEGFVGFSNRSGRLLADGLEGLQRFAGSFGEGALVAVHDWCPGRPARLSVDVVDARPRQSRTPYH